MKNRRVHLRIRGHVQGVAFRANARQEAGRRGLTGFVRNLDDGTVEAVAEGEAGAIDAFVGWCRVGPLAARVTSVDVSEGEATGAYSSFKVER